MARFQAIPQFTRQAPYHIDVPWHGLERQLAEYIEQELDLDPDFQRGHVWSEQQQIRYVEFILRGGMSGKDIFTNHPNWHRATLEGPFVLVDGKQRIAAVRRFLADEIPVFGSRYSEYEDRLPLQARFTWHVNDLATRAEVLRWYLEINFAGTPHTPEELARVEALLVAEEGA